MHVTRSDWAWKIYTQLTKSGKQLNNKLDSMFYSRFKM
jgi:hypothetical protein